MATTITTSFLKQGTCGTTGDIRTCFRYQHAGVSSTCDIGGSGSGTNYRNIVHVRFDSLPAAVSSAKLTITYQQSGSDYWNAAQTIGVRASANFSNSTTGAALPTLYGTVKTAELAGKTASITIDVTEQIQTALANNAKCLHIYANAADNRKRVNAITLTYEPLAVTVNHGAISGITTSAGQRISGVTLNGKSIA